MSRNDLRTDLLQMIGYLLATAHGLYEEPAAYAPFRNLDAAGRLFELMNKHSLDLGAFHDLDVAIQAKRFESMNSDSLRPHLDEMLLLFSQAAKEELQESED